MYPLQLHGLKLSTCWVRSRDAAVVSTRTVATVSVSVRSANRSEERTQQGQSQQSG